MSLLEERGDETAVETDGNMKGVAPAVVTQNKDDQSMGRVRVRYPWHSRPSDSYWARIAMPMAGRQRGIYFLPEVGDEVLVAFERGDLRFPYVVGALWNGEDAAPQTNGDGKNDVRVIRTRKGHSITFDDGDRGQLRLELNDGKSLTIDDEGIRIDDKNGNSVTVTTASGEIAIAAATSLTLKAPQITIDASTSLSMNGGMSASLQATSVTIN